MYVGGREVPAHREMGLGEHPGRAALGEDDAAELDNDVPTRVADVDPLEGVVGVTSSADRSASGTAYIGTTRRGSHTSSARWLSAICRP
jgi:hypothetical protein